MRHNIAHTAAGDNTDQPGNHEGVIENIFADARRTRAVKADACKI